MTDVFSFFATSGVSTFCVPLLTVIVFVADAALNLSEASTSAFILNVPALVTVSSEPLIEPSPVPPS